MVMVVVVVGGQHIQMHGGLHAVAFTAAATVISKWTQHGERARCNANGRPLPQRRRRGF